MIPRLPNLELLEFQAACIVKKDERYKNHCKQKKRWDYVPEMDCEMFSQVWANTMTAFDVDENGYACFGGDAMTKAYTVVFHEPNTDIFVVFVDNRFAYKVYDATEQFTKDFKNRNLRTVSEARKFY